MHCSKMAKEYKYEVENFIRFIITNAEGSSVIRFSCTKCMNLSFRTHKVVREHLYFHGFDVSYTTWSWHGEDVHDYDNGNTIDMVNDAYKDCAAYPKAFKELLEQAEKALY